MNENTSNYLTDIINQRKEIENKVESMKKKIEEKNKIQKYKKEIIKLNKEYKKLTYPERHPILNKLKNIIFTFRKESNELINKANEHNKNNPWN